MKKKKIIGSLSRHFLRGDSNVTTGKVFLYAEQQTHIGNPCDFFSLLCKNINKAKNLT